MIKEVMIGVAAFTAVTVVIVIGESLNYGLTSFFAPKYEAVRRDTMIESRLYTEATLRELYKAKREWDSAPTPEAKRTIELAARHQFEAFDRERLPADLRAWMGAIK